VTVEELKAKITDKLWRLCSLYSIKDAESGKVCAFDPRPEQMTIFRALVSGVRKIIILKARRLGMSTAIDIYAADDIAFNAGVQWSIVDQNQDDASKKLNNIVKIALESLPKPIRDRLKYLRSNDSAVEISTVSNDTPSAIYAGKNARGGTNQGIHVSEWGVVQADDPKRSEEILTGALPSAEHGVTIVETTWKGGKGGLLWNLVKSAMETPVEARGKNDWHLFFFPWWTDPTYSEAGEISQIDPETLKYLAEKEAEVSVKFTDRQKCWYARRKKTLGIFIFREFPTTIDECFRAPIEGAIYADIIDQLRGKGSIRPEHVDGSALVHTFWDLGSPINTVVWYGQFVGPEIRIVDCDKDLDLTPVQRVGHMLKKGYVFGDHFLPHDAMATQKSGITFQAELSAAGLSSVRIVPKTNDIWVGINRLRQLMPRMTFRLPACDAGLEALSNYHTRRESSGGLATDIPVHDWSSHASDALRTLAEAEMAGMIKGESDIARKRINGGKPRVLTGFRDPAVSGPRPRVLMP
jgi:hypothetical protein